jgi:hypothetical protein
MRLTFDQIAEEAKAYSNLTSDQLDGMATETLHEQLSLRLVAEEEVGASKRALAGSANELLKRIRADVLCINREIRRRHAAQKEEKTRSETLNLEALPEPIDAEVVA